jgi:hypothetical protein
LPTFADLAGLLRALPGDPGGSRCQVIAVDGLSGAGKTRFARRLAGELDAPVLSTDDLVTGWDGLAASIGLLTDWVLRPLAAGKPARWQRYDWLAGHPGEWVDLDPADFLIIEGCCVGAPPAAAFLSYLIWIDAPAAERRRRLEVRDDWPWYAPHAADWARQEAAIHSAARTPERANLIIDNGSAAKRAGRPATWTGPHAR